MKKILKFGINGNTLKIIALIAMLIDHIGFYFSPFINEDVLIVLRYIGRIAMPIFTYLLVQGFFHTSNFKKYILRILMWANITQVALWSLVYINLRYVTEYTAARYESKNLNVLYVFAIALLIMKILHEKLLVKKWDYNKNLSLKIICVTAIILCSVLLPIDYNVQVPLLALLFYLIEKLKITVMINTQNIRNIASKIIKKDTDKLIHVIYIALIFITLVVVVYVLGLNAFTLFAIVPIAIYNGERGNMSKILKKGFYFFFLLHHVALYSLALYLTLT